LAIDVARVQAHPKPCGIADLQAWNWAAKIRQRSDGAFRGLDFRRKRDRHVATVIAVTVTGVTEVGRKPQRPMDAPTPLLSSRRYALKRIEPAATSTSRQNAKPRYWSAATVPTRGSSPRAVLSRGRRGVDIEAGLDGMTSPMANNGVGDPVPYPPRRPAQPSAPGAAALQNMRMLSPPPQPRAAPVRGHAGTTQ
jgi:hypothetical protein